MFEFSTRLSLGRFGSRRRAGEVGVRTGSRFPGLPFAAVRPAMSSMPRSPAPSWLPAKTFGGFGDASFEGLGRSLSRKKLSPVVPPIDHMIAGTRTLQPQFPRHGPDPALARVAVNSPFSSSIGLVENPHMTPSDFLLKWARPRPTVGVGAGEVRESQTPIRLNPRGTMFATVT